MNRSCARTARRTLGTTASWLLAFTAAAWVGCGSGGKDGIVRVSGKVTHQGQPVTGGSLTFVPIASGGAVNVGKPATGEVKPDGSFVLGTNSQSDGALAGRHRVAYSPPAIELPAGQTLKEGQTMPQSPWAGLVPKDPEVEVTKGSNTLTIELAAPAGAGPTPRAAPAPR